MQRALVLLAVLLAPASTLAADWTARTSAQDRDLLRRALRSAMDEEDTLGRQIALEGIGRHHRAALVDLVAEPDAYPRSLEAPCWEALGSLDPLELERVLLGVVKTCLLDTPQGVLNQLGILARRAEPAQTTVAERTLLSLLKKAQQAPSGDWTDRLRIARALSEGGGRRSAKALVALMRRANPMTLDGQQVGESLAALAEHREVTVCQALLARMQKTDDAQERYLGHTALAAVASPRTRSYLRTSVKAGMRVRDQAEPVAPDLRAAIDALGQIDTPSAIRSLIDQEAFVARDDVALRIAVYQALGQAERSAEVTELVPALVDWLGEAEAEGESKQLRKALVDSLRRLTGKRFSLHHASWARYVASLDEE